VRGFLAKAAPDLELAPAILRQLQRHSWGPPRRLSSTSCDAQRRSSDSQLRKGR
jgi:hypothetical protein